MEQETPKPQKTGIGLLITQSVVTLIFLGVALAVRFIGGDLFTEWRSAWERSLADNHWIDMAVSAVLGEPDGEPAEVTP